MPENDTAFESRVIRSLSPSGSRIKAKGRTISGTDEESGLREPQASYSNDFEANKDLLSTQNVCFGNTPL